MIYVDTSVVLAHLLAEDRTPPVALWKQTLVSSFLLQYEVWVTIHRRRLTRSHGELAHAVLGQISTVDLSSTVLSRALEPFPSPLGTLDALHLATAAYLHQSRQTVMLASYDEKMRRAAKALGIGVFAL